MDTSQRAVSSAEPTKQELTTDASIRGNTLATTRGDASQSQGKSEDVGSKSAGWVPAGSFHLCPPTLIPSGQEKEDSWLKAEMKSLDETYQKLTSKKIKSSLSSFMSSGESNIDGAATADDSLRSLIEKPPIGGRSLDPLPQSALQGFRLRPGPVADEYRMIPEGSRKKAKRKKHKHLKHSNPMEDGGGGSSGGGGTAAMARRCPALSASGSGGSSHGPSHSSLTVPDVGQQMSGGRSSGASSPGTPSTPSRGVATPNRNVTPNRGVGTPNRGGGTTSSSGAGGSAGGGGHMTGGMASIPGGAQTMAELTASALASMSGSEGQDRKHKKRKHPDGSDHDHEKKKKKKDKTKKKKKDKDKDHDKGKS